MFTYWHSSPNHYHLSILTIELFEYHTPPNQKHFYGIFAKITALIRKIDSQSKKCYEQIHNWRTKGAFFDAILISKGLRLDNGRKRGDATMQGRTSLRSMHKNLWAIANSKFKRLNWMKHKIPIIYNIYHYKLSHISLEMIMHWNWTSLTFIVIRVSTPRNEFCNFITSLCR